MKWVIPTIVLAICSLGVTWMLRGQLGLTGESAGEFAAMSSDVAWPPTLNEPYPELTLLDQNGTPTRLVDFRGRLILVEPIGMPCKACQAFCGGHELGGFQGIAPQPDLPSIRQSARDYGGFELSDPRLVKVYLLLYGLDMKAPTVADAKAWADHFGLRRADDEIVLVGTSSLIGPASYQMIPGLQVIDDRFVLRLDSTGRTNQTHDLYRQLLPRLGEMLSRSDPTEHGGINQSSMQMDVNSED